MVGVNRKRCALTWLPKVNWRGEDGYKYTEVSLSLGYNISFAQGLFLMPHFDYHFRYALITYSQCGDLSPERVGERFQELGALLVIGRENHADGGIHLHCFVDFGRKRRFRRVTCFDVDGRHPNIEQSRGTPEKGYDYATKDGDIVFRSLDRPTPSGGGNSKTVAKWTEITTASDRESFWDLVHQLIQKVRQLISPNFKSTVTGSLHLSLPSMSPLGTLSSLEEMLMDEIAGYFKLASDVDKHE